MNIERGMDYMSFNEHVKSALVAEGAALVGFGDISALPSDAREGMPVGISVAVLLPKDVVRGIADLPTQEYFEWYCLLNDKLDGLAAYGAGLIAAKGYKAVANIRERVGSGGDERRTKLPHKTVATRAGIGWIGKCALLVTKEYGSMIRLTSILTDAPLDCAAPVDESKCGGCSRCADACPGKAISGKLWHAGLAREEFFDADACANTARERSMRGFGGQATICGKCIEICPHTRAYLNR